MLTAKLPFYQIWKDRGATFWKRRRFEKILRLVPIPEGRPLKILEVGCANGKDFIQFLKDSPCEIWAVDIRPCQIEQEHVHFVLADAERLPFPNQTFDLVVSIGLLEHIEPMESFAGSYGNLNALAGTRFPLCRPFPPCSSRTAASCCSPCGCTGICALHRRGSLCISTSLRSTPGRNLKVFTNAR